MMYFAEYEQFVRGEFIHKAGDVGKCFYFVMEGKAEVLVRGAGQSDFEFSKQIDEGAFFGAKNVPEDPRTDYARVTSDKMMIIKIDTRKYSHIVKTT